MNRQNEIWKFLNTDIRRSIKNDYKAELCRPRKDQYNLGVIHTFENIFGLHNLASESEQPEMLMIPKKQIEKCFEEALYMTINQNDVQLYQENCGACQMLIKLFGESVLNVYKPMMPRKIDASESLIQMAKAEMNVDTPVPYVSENYKYDVSEFVVFKNKDKQIKSRKCENGIISYEITTVNGLSPIWVYENELEPYIVYHPDDKVIVKDTNEHLTIREVFYNTNNFYWYAEFNETDGNYTKRFSELAPYTEDTEIDSKFHKGDTVKNKLDGKTYTISDGKGFYNLLNADGTVKDGSVPEQYLELCENNKSMQLSDVKGKIDDYFESHTTDEVIETFKKYNMIEKTHELNLEELLSNCENIEFYTTCYGNVVFTRFERINDETRLYIKHGEPGCYTGRYIFSSGKIDKDGEVVVYPTRELYLKYPLDPYSAWMEWKESMLPKRWRAVEGEDYWYFSDCGDIFYQTDTRTVDDNFRFNMYNYFRSKKEAIQAVEVIIQTLKNVYEQNLNAKANN